MNKLLFIIILITLSEAFDKKVVLKVKNATYFNGPEKFGINMGHAGIDSNWVKFFNRLGVNAARLFVAPISDLRAFIGSKNWGINLKNERVIGHSMFLQSINELKQTNNITWANKVFDKLAVQTNNKITGSIESSISILNQLNINTLVVLNIGCSKANMNFEFKRYFGILFNNVH